MALHERYGILHIWWFPKEFSQSRYGEYHESGTNSCTLISLILGDKVSKESIGSYRHSSVLPQRAVDIFGSAINDGNSVYHHAIKLTHRQMSNLNLNIPDALSTLTSQPQLNFQLHEWFYTHLQADPSQTTYSLTAALRLSQIFNIGMDMFRQPGIRGSLSFLFVALIADSRTVIFIFEFPSNVVAFFDSHQHGHAGAVVAQCNFGEIFELALWFVNMLNDVYHSKPSLFEVSFLTTEMQHAIKNKKISSEIQLNQPSNVVVHRRKI